MMSLRVLIVCAALCVGDASKEESVAQRLWQQAWSEALDNAGLSNANVDNMPSELKDSLQQKAIKIWKMALAQRQAAESTTTVAETTTTQNVAMTALLSGIDGHQVVDLSYQASTTTTTTTTEATTTTTTTSTEDLAAKRQKGVELAMMQKAAMSRLTEGMGKEDMSDASTTTTEATTTETTTTTENKAMMALLAGVEPGVPASKSAFLANPAPTTTTTTTMEATTTEATTTTEDPRAVEEREHQKQQLLEMHKNVMSKLTAGFDQITKEEATATTTTEATTTTTTTTTKNAAMQRLLDGVDGPAVAPKSKDGKKATTTTTTTTTTTGTIGAAGKKTLAFITSGTFSWQGVKAHHQEPAVQEEDDEDQDKAEPTDGGEAAADFDMDNSA